MKRPSLPLWLALLVVDAAAGLAPEAERPALRGEWKAELWHRALHPRRGGAGWALPLRSLGCVPDALDLRFRGGDGGADPRVEGARIARAAAGLGCAAGGLAAAAYSCAVVSVLATGGPAAWGRIDGGARAFILAVGALWSVALLAASIAAARRLRTDGWPVSAAGGAGLAMALAAAHATSSLPGAALPLRTAAAWLVLWAASGLLVAAGRASGRARG